MPVQGKAKGNAFERKMSNLFSKRFESVTGLTTGFTRNCDSGSFFGGSNMKRMQTHDTNHAFFGDIKCPDNFRFSIECKFYKTGPTFSSIVKGKITQFDDWIAQSKQDAANSNKAVMLIIKFNGVPELCFTSTELPSLQLVMPYKGMFGYRLEDVLTLPDNIFFTSGVVPTK